MIILLEDGGIIRDTDYWRGKSGRKVYFSTIESLYDRYLVKIIVESRHRRRHTVILTEVGQYCAKEIQREFANAESSFLPHKISEQTALFITEVVG